MSFHIDRRLVQTSGVAGSGLFLQSLFMVVVSDATSDPLYASVAGWAMIADPLTALYGPPGTLLMIGMPMSMLGLVRVFGAIELQLQKGQLYGWLMDLFLLMLPWYFALQFDQTKDALESGYYFWASGLSLQGLAGILNKMERDLHHKGA